MFLKAGFGNVQGTIEELFKKAFAEKSMAQGTIEYLLVVSVVVVIGLVAVSVLSGAGEDAGDFERRSSSVSWLSGSVALVEGLVDANGEWVLAVKNNGQETIFLNRIVVDDVVFDLNGFSLSGFAERVFLFKNDFSIDSCENNFKAIDVSLKYTSRHGISNIISNNYKFYLDCVKKITPNYRYFVFGDDENENQFSETDVLLSFQQLTNEDTAVVRVRRSSDNAQADFTAEELVDGTLESWVGIGDGFVRTWYDQRFPTSLSDRTGNRDAVQTTNNNQPILVSNGVLIKTSNGFAALRSTAFEQNLNITDLSLFRDVSSIQSAVFGEFESDVSARRAFIYSTTPAGGAITRYEIASNSSQWRVGGRRLDSDSFTTRSSGSTAINTPYVVSSALIHEQNKSLVKVNGNLIIDNDYAGIGTTSDTDSERITLAGGANLSNPFFGLISEVIIITNNFEDGELFDNLHDNLLQRYDLSS